MPHQPPGPEKSLSCRQALRLGTQAFLGSVIGSPALGKIALPPARTRRIFFGSNGGARHSVLTFLVAHNKVDEDALAHISISPNERGWFFEAEDIRGVFDTSGGLPELIW